MHLPSLPSPFAHAPAFAAPHLLLRAPPRPCRAAAPAICMHAKGKGKPKGNPQSSASSASAPGTGFGAAAAPSAAPSAPKKKRAAAPPPPAPAQDSANPDERLETASGAPGDATPKRIMRPDAPSSQLVDPAEQAEEEEAPFELVALPLLDAAARAELQLPRDLSPDAIIEKLADARLTDHFAAVVVANRHLITDDVLYRFTSAILQVEGRESDADTRDEEARNMRNLRKDIIAHTWSHDFSYKVAVQLAEKRLVPVLQGDAVGKDVSRAAGGTRVDVNAFWTVIYAAVAAWEERGRENEQLVNVDMQKALTEAAEACRSSTAVARLLSPCLAAAQDVLASSDPAAQQKAIEALADEDVDELGSLVEAIRLLPTLAYGGIAKRLGDIHRYVLKARFDIDVSETAPFRFKPREIERSSRLVQFSKRSEGVRRRE